MDIRWVDSRGGGDRHPEEGQTYNVPHETILRVVKES